MRNPIQRLPSLDLLLTFDAAARHLSFTRAGEERFITQSAVSRQIRTLEDALGVALFARGHRSLALTAQGQVLAESCAEAIAAAVHAQGVALGRRPLVDALLADGSLIAPIEGTIASARAYFVVVNQATREQPGTRALADWLIAQAVATGAAD